MRIVYCRQCISSTSLSTMWNRTVPRLTRGTLPVLIASIVAFVVLPKAQAVPVNYDEIVDGDLAGFGPFPVLPFDVGLNTVTGNFGFTLPGPTDWDSFAFSIPAGAELTGAALSLSDSIGNVGSSTWRFRRGSNVWNTGAFRENIQTTSPGFAIFTTPPEPAGVYNVSHISFGIFVPGPTENTANYEFSFRVDTIPEPSTTALAAAGLLALGSGFLRRNTRSLK
jgi:hypothetical protein